MKSRLLIAAVFVAGSASLASAQTQTVYGDPDQMSGYDRPLTGAGALSAQPAPTRYPSRPYAFDADAVLSHGPIGSEALAQAEVARNPIQPAGRSPYPFDSDSMYYYGPVSR